MSLADRDEREFREAVSLHQAGNLAAAIRAYEKLLKRSPKNPIILNLHGLAGVQSGQFEEAAKSLSKALALKPDIPDGDYNLATVLQRLGRFAESVPHFEKAIAAKPNDADAHNNFGTALKALERADEAITQYRAALSLAPNHAGVHLNLGNALGTQGKEAEAIPHFEKSIELDPRNPGPYIGLGNALHALGRSDEALPKFEKAIQLNPQDAEAYACRGLALASLKRFDEAAGHFLRATQLKPDFAEAFVELGNALQKIDKHDEAVSAYRQAIKIKPDFVEAYFNLAEIFNHLERFDEMLEPLQKAIAVKPDFVNAISLLGGYYCLKQQYEKSEGELKKSLSLDPSSPTAHLLYAGLLATLDRAEEAIQHLDQGLLAEKDIQPEKSWHLGVLYLSLGKLSRGWELFGRRFLRPIHKRPNYRDYSAPLWNGEKVKGRILVWAEQGLGDEIIYSSMLPELKKFADDVVVECSARLVPLFERSFPTIHVVSLDHQKLFMGEIAAHCPMGDLGKFLRPNLESFPAVPAPYLYADQKRTNELRRIITKNSKFAVGVSWRSANAVVGEMKSARLLDFESLFQIQNCRFVSLQYGDTEKEREGLQAATGVSVSPVAEIDNTQDIDGLAALICACDAVVTTSNTTAHLAGALGKHTWVLLPHGQARIWYWFKRRADSPWYSNVRLLRQGFNEPWNSVVQRASKEVEHFLQLQ